MSSVAIRVEHLGKRYELGKRRDLTDLRESVTKAFTSRFYTAASAGNGYASSRDQLSNGCIWALRDVSFDVKFGELIGIMGENGGGKTTLLSILSRITKPTFGYGEIHGRAGTLLDLGAGLHGELTGRENVYLNGAIKGMSRDDVRRKFDQIVAFAELERFLDTPLKHYSTGMCVRLAFAVAVHLDPDVLLVDEVLAQADMTFQSKCLGKMASLVSEGRTVLLVSHDSEHIRQFCTRAFVLSGGRIAYTGPAFEVVERSRQISSSQPGQLEAASAPMTA